MTFKKFVIFIPFQKIKLQRKVKMQQVTDTYACLDPNFNKYLVIAYTQTILVQNRCDKQNPIQ